MKPLLLIVATTALAQAQWFDIKTPGIPRLADGKPDLTAPAPKLADGHPDLSGFWNGGVGFIDMNRNSAFSDDLLRPEARGRFLANRETLTKGYMSVNCLPSGPNVAFAYEHGPAKFIHTPGLLVILYSDLAYRQIFLDGRPLPKDPNPSWMGYSVGRWEGSAGNEELVVETIGFNDRTWLDMRGHPHSEALRLSERYRRTDFGHIQTSVTLDDPATYAKPFTFSFRLTMRADDELLEYVCAENEKDRAHMVGTFTEANPPPFPVSANVLSKYIGTYEGVNDNRRMRRVVALEGSSLFITVSENERVELVPRSDTAFSAGNSTRYEFLPDGEGRSTALRQLNELVDWKFNLVKEGR